MLPSCGPGLDFALTLPLGTSPMYRGTSLTRNSAPLRPYSRNMPRGLWWFEYMFWDAAYTNQPWPVAIN